jgi:hypothetical protein
LQCSSSSAAPPPSPPASSAKTASAANIVGSEDRLIEGAVGDQGEDLDNGLPVDVAGASRGTGAIGGIGFVSAWNRPASFAGFTIRGDCTGSDVVNLVLTPPNATTDLKAFGNGNEEAFFSHAQEGDSAELNEENDRGETSFSAATLGGTVVSGNLGYEDPASFVDTQACAFYGQVLVTA